MAALAFAAALAGLASAAPTGTDSALVQRGGCACNTIPGIVADVDAKIVALNVQLNAAIAAAVKINGKVDVSVVTPCLLQLKQIIVEATAQIKVIADLGLDVILLSNGTLLSVNLCAQIFAAVFIKIVAVLKIAIDAVVQTNLCLNVIVDINVVIAALLQIVFGLVGGIQVAFCGLLTADVIAFIKVHALVDILGLIKIYININL